MMYLLFNLYVYSTPDKGEEVFLDDLMIIWCPFTLQNQFKQDKAFNKSASGDGTSNNAYCLYRLKQ